MKKALRAVLGDYRVLQIKGILAKYFPTQEEKEKRNLEAEEDYERKLFYDSFVKKDDLCFDVGANVGNRIRPLLGLGAKVLAVEPQQACYKILKYKFGKRIIIINKGLGESEGIKNFYTSDENVLSSFSDEWINSVKNSGRFQNIEWKEAIQVEITTLDKLIDIYGLPTFIKIDVEGYELEVLKGLTKPVKMISFEYTVPEQVNRLIECLEKIEKNATNIECNYSVGESMKFALQDWQSVDSMKHLTTTDEFIATGFGDIYVRTKT
ncbi:FkbM family methyltransferase [Spirosoma sp. KNUC1025]|uniref:FkbM family methyltransferase n=1 Tax=Spirosoma sp. KNUC1025 TaxID=2894082 RepID=UPI003870349C|nr:FkbM family methyltransferase [Spirosoma sp. KNUC1025]